MSIYIHYTKLSNFYAVDFGTPVAFGSAAVLTGLVNSTVLARAYCAAI